MFSIDVRIPYGLHVPSGRVIHVSEAENGLTCACICTSCRSALIARQGAIKVAHFAHAADAAHCAHPQETSLHAAAKQIIFDTGRVGLPPLQARHADGSLNYVHAEPRRTVRLSDVSLEHRGLAGIVPDVYAVTRDGPLIIEIHVHHAVDALKASRIAGHGIAAIEISLDLAVDCWSNPELFRSEVLSRAARHWVFHPRQAALDQDLAERLRRVEEARQAVLAEERARWESQRAAAEAYRQAEAAAVAAAHAARMEASRIDASRHAFGLAHLTIDALVQARQAAADERLQGLIFDAMRAENEARLYVDAAQARAAREEAAARYAAEQARRAEARRQEAEARAERLHQEAEARRQRAAAIEAAARIANNPHCHYCDAPKAWFGFGPPFRRKTIVTCMDCRPLAEAGRP